VTVAAAGASGPASASVVTTTVTARRPSARTLNMLVIHERHWQSRPVELEAFILTAQLDWHRVDLLAINLKRQTR
jgi:hypothetical protein